MSGGRTKIVLDLKRVRQLAAQGLNEEQTARALGICPSTLRTRKRDNSAFLEALKEGQAQGIEKITNCLVDQAEKGSAASAIFYLKNRAGWSDKIESDVNVKGDAALLAALDAARKRAET